MIGSILLWALALLLFAAGLAGLILPAMPGALLLLAGLTVAAWAEGFAYVGWRTLLVLTLLSVLTYVIDLLGATFGANRFGASKRGILGASIGMFGGLFLGFFGVLFGPFIGAMVGELTGKRDLSSAGRAGLGATLGIALAAGLKLAVAVSMLAIFVAVRFWGTS